MGSAVLTSTNAAWAWSVASPATTITIEAIGGGGCGGYGAATGAYCGGGKGGSYNKKTITKGAETTLNIVVGAGGQDNTANLHGTASSVTQGATVVLRAPGGNGVGNDDGSGAAGVNGTPVGDDDNAGGNGANSSSGSINGAGGGAGGPTGPGSGSTSGGGNFADGTHYCGDGGAAVAVNNAGNVGSNYGGGGSGGQTNKAADKAGGHGANGIVVITWTDSETHSGTALISGKGNQTATGVKGALASPLISGKGNRTGTGTKGALGTALVSGKGNRSGAGTKAAFGTLTLSGIGHLSGTGVKFSYITKGLSFFGAL